MAALHVALDAVRLTGSTSMTAGPATAVLVVNLGDRRGAHCPDEH